MSETAKERLSGRFFLAFSGAKRHIRKVKRVHFALAQLAKVAKMPPKEKTQNAPELQAVPASENATRMIRFDKTVHTRGLGGRGARKGLEGHVSFNWADIPDEIIVQLAIEGADTELFTASTVAERERDKARITFAEEHLGVTFKKGTKVDEQLKVANAAIADHVKAGGTEPVFALAPRAVEAMQERIEDWKKGDFGRTRGMSDPVEKRAEELAAQMVELKIKKGDLPQGATAEQKRSARDMYLSHAVVGPKLRERAREEIAEEQRRAQRAADDLASLV